METIIPSFADKVFHFGAYGVLTGVWFYTFNYRYNMSRIKALLIISTACIAFGIIIEVLQKELTNTRYFDWYDILANVGGVLLATYLVLFFKKSDVK
ncbi:teicoplanin resistance protein VanZ [Bizionia argentinensis JUB59]|uniref:Teicoplanin resistance protein VanZ n=1 Tax=Bizionia argentinensis JUB59 TaxID=1046627 RepID=G2EFT2_9FLAO|nr:teicoplanin resistance protein VanZ [Bizionia argentinensis JUB59]